MYTLCTLLTALRTFGLSSIFENFYFDPSAFLANLKYMGLGMLAIFLVIGVIVVITYLLNMFLKDKKK